MDTTTTTTTTSIKPLLPESGDSAENWLENIDEHFDTLLNLALQPTNGDSGSWKYWKNKHGIDIFSREFPNRPNGIFSIGELPYSPIHILRAWRNPDHQFSWDSYLDKISVVETLKPHIRLVHMSHKASWGVASRFTLAVRAVRIIPGSAVQVQKAPPKKKGWFAPQQLYSSFVPLKTPVKTKDVMLPPFDPSSKKGDALTDEVILVALYSVTGHPTVKPNDNQVPIEITGSGWLLKPIKTGEKPVTRVVYIANLKLGGSLPTLLQNTVNLDVGMIIDGVGKYLDKNGPENGKDPGEETSTTTETSSSS